MIGRSAPAAGNPERASTPGSGFPVPGALFLVFLLIGCARNVPPTRPAAALYRDLERLVTVTAAGGWGLDRREVDALLPAALDSLCRVEPLQREALRAWLDVEIERAGGPVESAWRRRGKKLGKVSDLLRLTRIRAVLGHAIVQADQDCPFWLEPDEGFAGRQISDDRFQLSFGGGGKAIAVVQGDRTDLNFGGAGRLLFGRTFGSRAGVYVGAELGASASFPKDDLGERSSLLFGFDLVTPVVYRHTLTNTYLEAEAGWVGHVTEDDLTKIDHGVHVGVAFGGRATRRRFLFPGAALGLSYERTDSDDAPPLHAVKLGFRVAFDWDL